MTWRPYKVPDDDAPLWRDMSGRDRRPGQPGYISELADTEPVPVVHRLDVTGPGRTGTHWSGRCRCGWRSRWTRSREAVIAEWADHVERAVGA